MPSLRELNLFIRLAIKGLDPETGISFINSNDLSNEDKMHLRRGFSLAYTSNRAVKIRPYTYRLNPAICLQGAVNFEELISKFNQE